MSSRVSNEIRRNVKRIPSSIKEPQTLADLFSFAFEKRLRPDALNYKKDGEWRSISSSEMVSRIENIALGLFSLGVRRGDKAAILAANSPEWTLADAGCQFSGVIDVPIYTTLAPETILYIVKDSGAKVFFIQDRAAFERLCEILPECETLEKLIFFDFSNVETENAISLAELELSGAKLKNEKPKLVEELKTAVKSEDVATLIYTSGTTGEPKGVMLTHENIVSNVLDVAADFSFSENDVPLSVLPLSHIFERTGMYLYIFNGMRVYYAESIDKAADNLREARPTIFIGVPRIFEKIYERARKKSAAESRLVEMIFDRAIEVGKTYARTVENRQTVSRLLAVKHEIADRLVFSKFRAFFGGRLRFCITGGAALSEDTAYIFGGAGVSIMQGYGLTETAPVISTNTPLNAKVGTVGKPIRNVEIRIAGDGEIEVTGANVMIGYFNKPEAARQSFTADGWFKTGDIGAIDAEGFLKITDRKKELFKTSGGKYIAPAPIEQMLKASRFISQVVLVGNGRKFPAALVVPDFEALENYAKLKNLDIKTPAEFCAHPRIIDLIERQIAGLTQNLSKFEKIKKIALLENEFTVKSGELTPTLKIKRRVIDEKYSGVIEKIYSDSGAKTK
ncbi:MAG: AMP-dependent synthetase/ligase [Pyrinomonadaceae bacterium]